MLPTSLAGWQGALELYSNALSRATAHLYANEVYTLLKQGFSASTDKGEVITVAPQSFSVQTNQPRALAATTTASDPAAVKALPAGCSNDGKTDYHGAIDCILNPAQHDCELVPGTNAPCNYFSSSHYAPNGSRFVSGYTVHADGTNNVRYSINYNHRQAWVPASSIVVQTP